ncbi:MAG TPA: AAA family ATPase [Steroidobacteraceae bacterium]|nr:AAA family ATPase [Steroidobacteraceae bacterium]
MSASLPRSLERLLQPEVYPHPVDRVELVSTHVSWVLLAGEYAYKIKRPVHYPFVDLTSLERRKFLCEEELRLNRRFAPELYLDVCKVVQAGGAPRMIASNEPSATACGSKEEAILDYAVRMHRFPQTEELDRLLEAHRIESHELETFGRRLAQVHARLPVAPATSSWGNPQEVRNQLLRNLLESADAAAVFGWSREVLALQDTLQGRLAAAASSMVARRTNGKIRECHGDLHCRNIVRAGGGLVPFDCLEYEAALRWIDTADEIAFLLSDLKVRGAPLHAHAFRGGYLAESGDYHACRVLALYEAHRALVRAKVAALSAAQNDAASAQAALRRDHLRLISFAADALAPKTPGLLLMSGLSGSGKTWLARQLAERLLAVHIRSDVERKRRAGLHELASSHSRLGEGLYSPEASATLYAGLARATEDVLSGGITAIVDATFLERAQRACFAELAARLGLPLRLILCEAPEPILRARIVERNRMKRDAAEADLRVLEWQSARMEKPSADEGIDMIPIETARSDALEWALRDIGSASPGAYSA